MTDLQKLEARIEAVDTAIAATYMARGVDRKMWQAPHVNDHYTKALTELHDVQIELNLLRTRLITVGR